MTYNPLGQKTSATDPAGRRTQFEYDGAGRLKAVIDNLNQRTEYSYDAQGNMIAQKDARGNVTKMAFDEMNRQIGRELPLGQRESMRYDGQGRLVEKTDFNGRSTTHQYDINDRLIQVNHADGRTTLFQYAADGQRTRSEQRFTNGAVEITTYTYDERSRLKHVIYPDDSYVRYAYDAAGNRTELQTPSGTVGYEYDELNRLTAVLAPEGESQHLYDAAGNLIGIHRSNGVSTVYQHNPRNQLTGMRHLHAGTVLLDLNYTLDASGMRLQIEETSGPVGAPQSRLRRIYTHDAALRLTQETTECSNALGCAEQSLQWTYDATGNRLTQVHTHASGSTTTDYLYDANDRLVRISVLGTPENGEPTGITTQRFDANGNLIETGKPLADGGSQRTLYGWNTDNQLLSSVDLQYINGQETRKETRYTYNSDGIRRTQTTNFGEAGATTIQYLIDPNQPYAQVLEETVRPAVQGGAGALVARYTYGDDLLAQVRTGVTSANVAAGAAQASDASGVWWYHYDGLGTTRLLSNTNGEMSDVYSFDAFGNKQQSISTGTTPNNYLYAGEQFDPGLGWYALRARYMDTVTGRFASSDQWAGDPFSPMSLHKYAYVHNMPTHGTDPSGYSLLMMGPSTMITSTLRSLSVHTARRAARRLVNHVIAQVGNVRQIVRRCLRNKKNECWDIPVLVVGKDNEEMARHIWEAQTGQSNNIVGAGFMFSYKYRKHTDWYIGRHGCTETDLAKALASGVVKPNCDEFPMNTMDKGGAVNHIPYVSLRYVNGSQNKSVGALWKNLVRASKMKNDPNKRALVIAWDEIPFSAYLPD